MTQLLYFFTLFSCLSLFAIKPLIINGVKTNGYAPVLQLKIGSADAMNTKSNGSCTGTFFKKGYIITAAHCIEAILLEQRTERLRYIHTGEKLAINAITSLYINNENVPRVEAYYIHPMYNSLKELELNSSAFLSDLDLRMLNREITNNQALKLIEEYKDLLLVASSRFPEFDLAIVKVKPLSTDEVFPIKTESLDLKDEVYMVGYGYDLHTQEIEKRKTIRGGYAVLAQSDVSNKVFHQRKYNALVNENLSHVGIKKVGINIVSGKKDGTYQIIGTVKNKVKSYFDFMKSFYSWVEADGVNVSASSGDSGGPLLKRVGNQFFIHGITSGVIGVDSKGEDTLVEAEQIAIKSVYTDLSSSLSRDFIESILSL